MNSAWKRCLTKSIDFSESERNIGYSFASQARRALHSTLHIKCKNHPKDKESNKRKEKDTFGNNNKDEKKKKEKKMKEEEEEKKKMKKRKKKRKKSKMGKM